MAWLPDRLTSALSHFGQWGSLASKETDVRLPRVSLSVYKWDLYLKLVAVAGSILKDEILRQHPLFLKPTHSTVGEVHKDCFYEVLVQGAEKEKIFSFFGGWSSFLEYVIPPQKHQYVVCLLGVEKL